MTELTKAERDELRVFWRPVSFVVEGHENEDELRHLVMKLLDALDAKDEEFAKREDARLEEWCAIKAAIIAERDDLKAALADQKALLVKTLADLGEETAAIERERDDLKAKLRAAEERERVLRECVEHFAKLGGQTAIEALAATAGKG